MLDERVVTLHLVPCEEAVEPQLAPSNRTSALARHYRAKASVENLATTNEIEHSASSRLLRHPQVYFMAPLTPYLRAVRAERVAKKTDAKVVREEARKVRPRVLWTQLLAPRG